jgi:hypothetical protein
LFVVCLSLTRNSPQEFCEFCCTFSFFFCHHSAVLRRTAVTPAAAAALAWPPPATNFPIIFTFNANVNKSAAAGIVTQYWSLLDGRDGGASFFVSVFDVCRLCASGNLRTTIQNHITRTEQQQVTTATMNNPPNYYLHTYMYIFKLIDWFIIIVR